MEPSILELLVTHNVVWTAMVSCMIYLFNAVVSGFRGDTDYFLSVSAREGDVIIWLMVSFLVLPITCTTALAQWCRGEEAAMGAVREFRDMIYSGSELWSTWWLHATFFNAFFSCFARIVGTMWIWAGGMSEIGDLFLLFSAWSPILVIPIAVTTSRKLQKWAKMDESREKIE